VRVRNGLGGGGRVQEIISVLALPAGICITEPHSHAYQTRIVLKVEDCYTRHITRHQDMLPVYLLLETIIIAEL
jgi:hypothetical protein